MGGNGGCAVHSIMGAAVVMLKVLIYGHHDTLLLSAKHKVWSVNLIYVTIILKV